MGFEVDASSLDELVDEVRAFADGSLAIVNDVIHGEAGGLVRGEIMTLLPQSGRSWTGKAPAAAAADPFARDVTNEPLQVTVHTRSKYHYLYFPDDGSSTARHAGGQNFMGRGAEAAAPEVLERCLAALEKNWSD